MVQHRLGNRSKSFRKQAKSCWKHAKSSWKRVYGPRPLLETEKSADRLLEPSWGRRGAVLGLPPQPGEAPGGHLLMFFGTSGAGALFFVSVMFYGVYFYHIFAPLLPSLLRARLRREHGTNIKNVVFCGSQAICAFFAQGAQRPTFRGDAKETTV